MLKYIFKNYRLIFLTALGSCLITLILGYYLIDVSNYGVTHGGMIAIFGCITGILIPIILIRKIKCPKCNSMFYWEYLNRGASKSECSKCGLKFE